MLSTSAIRKAAEGERDRLQKISKWAAAYKDATPQEPLLVAGEDAGKEYYLVQFRQHDRTTGLMRVNALTGKVGSISGIQHPGASLDRFYRPEEIPQLVAQQPDLYAHGEPVKPADITVQPTLYWVSCDQSVTPFQPFYVAKVPGLKDLYVRVDGEVFTRLTDGFAGM